MSDSAFRTTANRLARLYCELWSTGDVNIVDQVFPAGAQHVAGLSQSWGDFITDLRRNFPDLARPLDDTYIDGEIVILKTRMQGTHTGSRGYFSFPATGARMDIPAVTAFRVENDLLAEEIWSEYDLASVEKEIITRLVTDYLEKVWGDGDMETLKSHVASGHLLHLNGRKNAVEGRRRFGTYIEEIRSQWDDGVFRVDDCVAGGDFGERVAYRWTAGEAGSDSPALSGFGFARIENGIVAEEWLQVS